MLEDSLSYPTNGDSGLVRILIGGALGVLSLLFFPAFLVTGYMVRAMAASSRGVAEPPAFEDWTGLFVDGIKATVVGTVYSLVPMVLMLLTVGMLSAGSSAGGNAGGLLVGLGAFGLFVGVILVFAIQYVFPAALTNLGREGRLGAAFDFDTLKPVLTSREYIKAVVLMFGAAFVSGIAFMVFALFTLGIGYLVAPFFSFWLYLAGSYMFGTAFGDVVEVESPGASQQVQLS